MKQRLAHAEERLDAPVHDVAELAHSLTQVAAVNRFLGGTRAALRAIDDALPGTGTIRILDVGCGSGDVPAEVARRLRRAGRDARIVAVDLHPQILAIAAQRLGSEPRVALARAHARALPFPPRAFDIALMSLTLHHFEDEAQLAVLRELGRVARVVIINDLERCWPNYAGARLLALTLWAGNRLTRHDGPLSVLRAFTARELEQMGRDAGLANVRVRRRFFHRLVLTGRAP